jgi:hypothetical protein
MAPRSAGGIRARKHELVAFTDGDRQFKLADLARLIERHAEPDRPDVVVGYRLKRADPPIRLAYARVYRLALRIFFRLHVRDVDCACKLFRRPALDGVRLESRGAFLSAELLIKLGRARSVDRGGRRAALPAHGRLRRQAPTRRWCCARSATSGGCGCSCGRGHAPHSERGEPVLAAR